MPLVRYWAGARDLAGTGAEEVAAGELRELLGLVGGSHGSRMTDLLPRCIVLVDGEQAPAHGQRELASDAVVEILPPYAGG